MSFATNSVVGFLKGAALANPTAKINHYFNDHHTCCKIALYINHIFRMLSMLAFMSTPFFSPMMSASLCLAGSLFYRLTVENNCAYKFALSAYAGALALQNGQFPLIALVSGAAFSSLRTFANTIGAMVFFPLYCTYIIWAVDQEVTARCKI